MRCTGPIFVVLQFKTGVLLRAKKQRTTLWALRLRKDFTFTLQNIVVVAKQFPCNILAIFHYRLAK